MKIQQYPAVMIETVNTFVTDSAVLAIFEDLPTIIINKYDKYLEVNILFPLFMQFHYISKIIIKKTKFDKYKL